MKPTIGRIVHFRSSTDKDEPFCVAAIVTKTYPDDPTAVDLHVFWPTLLAPVGASNRDFAAVPQGAIPGNWHWPERRVRESTLSGKPPCARPNAQPKMLTHEGRTGCQDPHCSRHGEDYK